MSTRAPWAALAVLTTLLPLAAGAQGTLVIDGADALPASGPRIVDARMVVVDGRIAAIGPAAEVKIPEGARVLDRRGRVLIPGLVDTHTHVGLYGRPDVPAHEDVNETSDPLQPGVRALDGLWPGDPGLKMALAGGVTTANIMPGSGNPVGGQTVYVKLRGATADAMVIEGTVGGMKMANGENPKLAYGARNQAPVTRMGVAALQRGLFVAASTYRTKWAKWRAAQDPDEAPPARDLGLDAMVEVLEGRRTVHYHAHRADDIVTALRLREEFGFDLVLHHASEAFKVADQIAAAGVPVSVTVLDSPGGKPEAAELGIANAGVLERAGVRVAINSDDPVTPSRLLLRSAALAVRGGMSEQGALRAVTLEAARMLRLDGRLGSLEPGKDADFVVLSGEPFSVYTQVLETWIEGERVFDRSDPKDLPYAVGGFAAGAQEAAP